MGSLINQGFPLFASTIFRIILFGFLFQLSIPFGFELFISMSDALGEDVYHYHLHVVYIPAVEKQRQYQGINIMVLT